MKRHARLGLTQTALLTLLLALPAQAQNAPEASAAPPADPAAAGTPQTAPLQPPDSILPDPDKQKFFLTLTEAIDVAQKQNHDILLAEERIRDARLQITETGAQGLPQLAATASYGRQDPVTAGQVTNVGAGGAAGGGLTDNPQFAAFLGTASVNTFQSNVTLSQTLFAGFRIVDAVRLANVNVDMMLQALRQTRQNVAFRVTNAYFNALRAWQVVQIEEEALAQAREQIRAAEVRLKAGTGVRLDLLQAQSQMLQIQQRLSQSVNAYEKAKMQLNQVMGRETDYPVLLNNYATVAAYQLDEAQSLQTALENRADLRQIRLQKEISEMNAVIQGRTLWPTISAQVRYSLQDNAVVNGNSANIQNLNYGLNMNWPIFDGLAAQSKVQRAENSAQQAQINLNQKQQQVILDVRQAYMDVDEVLEREQLALAGVELAKENLRVARISYREGVGVMLDVITAQNNLQQAQNNLVTARFDLNIRRAALYQALGLDIIDQLR